MPGEESLPHQATKCQKSWQVHGRVQESICFAFLWFITYCTWHKIKHSDAINLNHLVVQQVHTNTLQISQKIPFHLDGSTTWCVVMKSKFLWKFVNDKLLQVSKDRFRDIIKQKTSCITTFQWCLYSLHENWEWWKLLRIWPEVSSRQTCITSGYYFQAWSRVHRHHCEISLVSMWLSCSQVLRICQNSWTKLWKQISNCVNVKTGFCKCVTLKNLARRLGIFVLDH